MRRIAAIFCITLLISCGGRLPQLDTGALSVPSKKPVALILEHEISGKVLNYSLSHPSGIAVDSYGNIYLSDGGNHRIIKFDREFMPIRDYGGYGSGIGNFQSPEDIWIDRGLNLYVLDSGNRRIIQLDANLNYIDEIIPEGNQDEIISPTMEYSGVVISVLGEMTVVDYDNSRLVRMDNFNKFSKYIGDFGYGRGALMNPTGIAVDIKGDLYVADAGNSRVAIYDDYGNYLREIGGGILERPEAITLSQQNNVWIADGQTNSIYSFSNKGEVLLAVSDSKSDRDFNGIRALAISREGKLYVADSGNNKVLIYRIVYETNEE